MIHDGVVHEVYNIGTDFEISIIDLARKMKYNMQHEPRLFNMLTDEQKQWIMRPADDIIVNVEDRIFNDTRYALNIDKIRSLGWTDGYDFNYYLIEVMASYIRNNA